MRKTEIKRIDFSKCRYANEIHAEIKNALNFPEHYGENLDALWDCLTGGIELSVCIKWSNYKASCHYLGEYAEKLRNVFEDAATELDNFSLQIEE